MKKSNVLIEKKNLTGLVRFLNESFKKQSGTDFSTTDIQSYVRRGHLPKYLGNIKIIPDKSVTDVKLYKIIKDEE